MRRDIKQHICHMPATPTGLTAFVVTIAIALGACSGSDDNADTGQALDAFVQKTPAEAEILVSDPLRFIAEYTDQAGGTIEEAIILVLESLIDPTAIPQQLEPAPDQEATVEYGDFYAVANQYRENGPDQQARERISTLLDRVFVPVDVLEKWADPKAGQPSSAAGVIIANAYAQSTSDACQEAWDGVFPVHTNPQYCFDVEAWSHRGAYVRIFYPIDWNSGDARFGWIGRTKMAINQSLDSFVGDLGLRTGDIDFLFYTNNINSRTRADAFGPRYGEACHVRMFPLGYVADIARNTDYQDNIKDNYRQTVAHEIYHCMQAWNFPIPFHGPYLDLSATSKATSIFHSSKEWWVEGTAEFFANYVYPCNQTEFERIGGFDSNSVDMTLLETSYENVVFFMDMGNPNPMSIIDMSRNMAVSGGMQEQYFAASAYGLGEIFHEFGQNYVDSKIQDSCPGVMMPTRPIVELYDVERGAERLFDMARFLLVRVDLNFMSGDYSLEYPTESVDARITAKEFVPEAAWEPPPAHVSVACGEPRYFRLVASYSQFDTESDELTVRETSAPDATPARSSSIDSCLLGRWQATSASMQEIGSWLAANPLTRNTAMTENKEISGQITGSFRRNGVVTGQLSDFTQKYLAQMDMGNRQLMVGTTVIMNDRSGARYSAEGGVLNVWDACTQPTVRAISELDGKVMSDMMIDMDEIANMDVVSGIGKAKGGTGLKTLSMPNEFTLNYRCSGRSLEIEHPDKGKGRPPWRFQKVADD